MAEKIVNGAFTTNLNSWSNYGSTNFYWSSPGLARAVSDESYNVKSHKLRQAFGVSGVASAAILNVTISWDIIHKIHKGSVHFYLYLRKPSGTLVELADDLETTDGGDSIGSAALADDLDISAYMTETGTYYLELWADCLSAASAGYAEYYESYGYYDNISLLVTERFYKTVIEVMGSGEITQKQAQASADEDVALGETLTHIGGYQPGVDPMETMLKREKIGIQERIKISVEANATAGLGFGESLERTYNYRRRDLPDMPNKIGLFESLVARWQSGNVTHTREILAEEDIWEDIAGVETNWEEA